MRKLVAVLSLALAASAAAGVWLWFELGEQREQNALLSAALEQQRSELLPSTASVDPAPATPVQTAANPVVPAPADVARPAEAPRVVQGTEEEWRAHQRKLFEDPRYREAWIEQRRLNYAPRRANLIRLIGLSPEQADAVMRVQIEREILWMSRSQLSTEDFPAEEASHQATLGNLIGEEKRQRLNEYMESRQSRMQVDRFRSELTEANMLRDDQVEPLITALHAERVQVQVALNEYRNSLPQESRPGESWLLYAEREIELTEDAHKRMRASAGGILSQGQLKGLDDLLKRELEQQRSQLRMQQLRSKMATTKPAD